MKLSDLVAYKNLIDTVSAAETARQCDIDISALIEIVNRTDLKIRGPVNDLDTSRFVISNAFKDLELALVDIRRTVQASINKRENDYFAASQELYQSMQHDSNEYILNRKPELSQEMQEFIFSRLSLYSDWRFPGLVLRPGLEPYTKMLVALDPLYLVDHNLELLEPVVASFTPEYQARLRKYSIDESSQNFLSTLPAQQFGFVFAHNYMQYKPMLVFQQYLTEIFDLLRPGGTFAFSFNDCDWAGAVKLCENHYHCYTPGHQIVKFAQQLGYEVTFQYHGKENLNWLELSKPGELGTIRGGQTLAVVTPLKLLEEYRNSKYHNNAEPILLDNATQKVYTSDEILSLQVSAFLLGIDTEERIFSVYTPDKLERLVQLRLGLGDIDVAKFNEKLERLVNKRKKT